MRLRTSILGLTLLASLGLAQSPGSGKVELKIVKYAGLADTIKQLKGKVITVDFWADT